jgi:hypothetical protein
MTAYKITGLEGLGSVSDTGVLVLPSHRSNAILMRSLTT